MPNERSDDGAARAWFARLCDGGWPRIERLVGEQQAETLHIDFKAKKNGDRPLLDKEDRRNLAEALSGFANSDGGVLVWGLDARRGDDGVDRLQGYAPILDLRGFRAAVEGEIGDAVAPPVPGLALQDIENPAQPETGVLVCLVPASDGGPHMATAGGQHRYYRRAGDSFRPMEHFEVAEMFGRRAHPRLVLDVRWDVILAQVLTPRDMQARAEVKVEVTVENHGRSPTRGLCVTLRDLSPAWRPVVPDPDTLYRTLPPPSGALARVATEWDELLFQGDSFHLLTHRFRSAGGNALADFSLSIHADCLGAPGVVRHVTVGTEDLVSTARERFAQGGLRGFGWG